jgi:hypothetical protein
MNRNLVGSTYGRFCIKFPQSRMKGERHRFSPISRFFLFFSFLLFFFLSFPFSLSIFFFLPLSVFLSLSFFLSFFLSYFLSFFLPFSFILSFYSFLLFLPLSFFLLLSNKYRQWIRHKFVLPPVLDSICLFVDCYLSELAL